LLARFTGDRFLPPTRAPLELDVTLRLSLAGVPTPEMLGYAVYPAGPLFRRSDVVTREIMHARDLATELKSSGDNARRRAVLESTIELIRSLVRAGAVHHDLNLTNVLIVHGSPRPKAFVIDVDRVEFRSAGAPDVAAANLRRLLRSARKWERLHQLRFAPGELDRLGSEVLAR
jgi:RIO-like serine/threonine protein kinase